MAGSADIKAGSAYVELRIKDMIARGLAGAHSRLMSFAKSAGAMTRAFSNGLKQIGAALTNIGARIGAVGAGITAFTASAVKTFLDVSKRAKELGVSISGIDPAKAEALADAIAKLRATWGAFQFQFGAALAEPLTILVNGLTAVLRVATEFIKQNPRLAVGIAVVGVAALAGGAALFVLGAALTAVGGAIGVAATLLGALSTPAGLAIGLFAALAAVALLAAAAFVIFAESSTGAISGLLAALATGDILKAWAIITKGIEVAWGSTMMFLISSMNAAIKAIGAAFSIWSAQLAADLRRAEKMTGLNLGSAAVGAIGAGVGAASTVTADVGNSTAAADVARAIAELAQLSQQSRDEFMKKFASVSIAIPDIAKIAGTTNRASFGTTGSTNSQTAGMNRELGSQTRELKKNNDLTKEILDVLRNTKATAELEFAS